MPCTLLPTDYSASSAPSWFSGRSLISSEGVSRGDVPGFSLGARVSLGIFQDGSGLSPWTMGVTTLMMGE